MGQDIVRFIAFDLETHLIQPGQICPRLVCMSWVVRDDSPAGTCDVYTAPDCEETGGNGLERGLCLRDRALQLIALWISSDDVCLVGHNLWFDLGVLVAEAPELMPLIFAKLDKGLIRDTQVRQQLLDIATGEMKFHEDEDEDSEEMKKTSYHLSDLAYRLLKKWLKKKDTWRLRYALLDGVPLNEWPEDAKKYAIDDSVTTLEIYEKQDEIAGVGDTCTEIPNAVPQHQAAWALHLMSVWGVRTDGEAVAKLKADLEKDFAAAMEALRPTGLLKFSPARHFKSGVRKGQIKEAKVSKIMKAIKTRILIAFKAPQLVLLLEHKKLTEVDLGLLKEAEIPLSDAGLNISTSKKTLVDSGDEDLKALAEAGTLGKLLNTYVPVLEMGTRVPITARYNVLVETGRASCSKPNLMNPPRAGGVRPCFVPRPGWVFSFADFDTAELRSLAQTCLDVFGESAMADALRAGQDLHLALAADMAGLSYEEAKKLYKAGDKKMKEDRQFCKIPNFGLPGGLGAATFVAFAEGYGTKITEDQARETIDAWHKRWPEMRPYFNWVSELNDSGEPIIQMVSGRVRGGAGYCAIANGFFQARTADGAKSALYQVVFECYAVPTSPLFGCRPWLFMHDEVGLEIPRKWIGAKRASEASARQAEVMISAMAKFVPDIPTLCSPYMARRWYKGAEAVRVNGVLVPSKPVETIGADGKEKIKWVADLDEVDAAEGLAA